PTELPQGCCATPRRGSRGTHSRPSHRIERETSRARRRLRSSKWPGRDDRSRWTDWAKCLSPFPPRISGRVCEALEQFEGSCEIFLLRGREFGLDGAEEPILLRRPIGLDQFPAGICERQDGLPSVSRVGRAFHEASSLKR